MKITLTQTLTISKIETKPIKSKICACNFVPTELPMTLVNETEQRWRLGIAHRGS